MKTGWPTVAPDQVAIYIRWSTDDQSEGTTLEVQREACSAYIVSQGWQMRPDLVFVDDGYSGANLDRPALARLRQAVQAAAVSCVVCFKLDRLSRNVVDTVKLVLEEWDGLCHFKSAREAIDTSTQQGRMFFYLLTSFAEWERAVIRERTHGGKLRRVQDGLSPGFVPPYGYRAGPSRGTLAVVGAEAVVVRRIFAWAVRGLGPTAIADLLNREGEKRRDGTPWKKAAVHYILHNPVYRGDLVLGRRPVNPRHGKRPDEPWRLRPDVPLIQVRAAFPAVVDATIWEQAQDYGRTVAAAPASKGDAPGR